MTKDNQTYFERRLLEERRRAARIVNRYAELASADGHAQAGSLSGMPLHMADIGTDTMQRELDAALAARATGELAEIDAALRRLYQQPDRFGVCEQTGASIPLGRLELVPWARTCVGA